jgi:hypothetical protein
VAGRRDEHECEIGKRANSHVMFFPARCCIDESNAPFGLRSMNRSRRFQYTVRAVLE